MKVGLQTDYVFGPSARWGFTPSARLEAGTSPFQGEDYNKKLFYHAYLWAFGYFFVGLLWVGNALLIDNNPYAWAWPLAVLGLPVLLSFFLAILLTAGRFLLTPPAPLFPALFASLFTIAEYARGHLFTGFPWNLPGMYWSTTLPVFQIVSVCGVYGLTFLTVFVAAHLTHKVCFQTRHRLLDVAVVLMCAGVLYFGIDRLESPARALPTHSQHIVMVQANIPQSERFDPDRLPEHFYRHLGLSERPRDSANAPTLVIWPETILPPSYLVAPAVQRAMRGLLRTYPAGSLVLAGAVSVETTGNQEHYFNSLVAFDQTGQAHPIYAKHHLVPFGEYIPYQRYIPLTPVARFENLTPGPGPAIVTLPRHAPFRPLICYESIFGNEVRANLATAEWLLVVTNDAWYGNSPGPYQHWAEARARAIEVGRPLVRVAVTGISSAFDAQGRILATMPYGTAGQRIVTLSLPDHPIQTIYARLGDVPLMMVMMLFLGSGLYLSRRRTK